MTSLMPDDFQGTLLLYKQLHHPGKNKSCKKAFQGHKCNDKPGMLLGGDNNLSYFFKLFKRIDGITPNEYRKHLN